MTGSHSHYPGGISRAGREPVTRARDFGESHSTFLRWRAVKAASNAVYLLLSMSGTGLLAQGGPTIVGSGPPHGIFVAPGEILTLQVVGLKTVLQGPVKASGFPLPTVLGGISVDFRRYAINLPGPRVAAPLFSIEQWRICGDEVPAPPDCLLTSVTIQVPFFAAILAGDRGVDLAISENGVSGKTTGAGGTPVNIHVLTACSGGTAGLCGAQVPAVTHSDGSLVTATSPAKSGEVVVIYATGLGATNPTVPAGQATPAPGPATSNSWYIQFDFTPNARPRIPDRYPVPLSAPRPEFVGLTPGQVGLYQLNVRIPETIPPVPACRVSFEERANVTSNLTITFVTNAAYRRNFDGAGICVTPPQ